MKSNLNMDLVWKISVFGASCQIISKTACSAPEINYKSEIWLVASSDMVQVFQSANNKGADQTAHSNRIYAITISLS